MQGLGTFTFELILTCLQANTPAYLWKGADSSPTPTQEEESDTSPTSTQEEESDSSEEQCMSRESRLSDVDTRIR